MAIIPQGGPLKVTSESSNDPAARSTAGNLLTRPLTLLATRLGFAAATITTLLVASWLRVWNLGVSDLWLDEAISYFVANRSPLEIVAYTAANIAEHPPGYYFLLHFWMRALGKSEFALRLFTVMGALLAITLTMLVARRWYGKGIALLAGVLLTVQPLAVFLGRDARMYSWFMAAVTLMVYLLDRAIHERRPANWLLFAAAALVALGFNYLATLVILALALFFVVCWRQLKGSVRPFALILVVLLGPPLLWIALEPGPRSSALALLDAMREPWTATRLLPVFLGWPLGGAADEGGTPVLVVLAAFQWLLVAAGIIFMIAPRIWRRRDLQWLLALLVVIPPLAGSFIFVISKARYYSAVLGFFTLAVTLGIVACWRRSRVLGVALVAALLFIGGRNALGDLRSGWRPFTPPMEHILVRAHEGEPVVYTYTWDKYLDLYYDSRKLPAEFIPAGDEPVSVETAAEQARGILDTTGSAWLVVYPSKLQPENVAAGFDRAGFPSVIEWFAGSRGVVRYFADRPLAEQPGGMTWGDDIRLVRWWTATAEVAAGDALRLQFEWQKLAPAAETGQAPEKQPSPLISLTLVGEDGRIWAARLAAPCNGACSPADWYAEPAQERQGLYIPLDTPPGRYELRLAWLKPDGEPILVRTGTDAVQQSAYRLMDVAVTPPTDGAAAEAPLARQSGMQTADGGLVLTSLAAPQGSVPVGGTVSVPMQWQVRSPQPSLELHLELSRDGQVSSLMQPLGPSWYGSDRWTPGRLVRVQPEFQLPGTLKPGEYTASLTLTRIGEQESLLSLPLGSLAVRDRERSFTMPDLGEAAGIEWQEGIQLARVAAPQMARAGETIAVTLVWLADRPTAGNWKVFIHLSGAAETTLAQGDGYPQGGAALTTTWQNGEVIADTHLIELAGDLPEGEYQLKIGFYKEETNERLPLTPGVDTYTWPKPITITRP